MPDDASDPTAQGQRQGLFLTSLRSRATSPFATLTEDLLALLIDELDALLDRDVDGVMKEHKFIRADRFAGLDD
ncbi:MAG: hypothetical protein E5Y69_29360, partial [Mesorhizobium sp.]